MTPPWTLSRPGQQPEICWDSYRRFLQMYGDVVMGVQRRPEEDHEPFESTIERLKDERYGNHHFPDTQLSTDDLKELVPFQSTDSRAHRQGLPAGSEGSVVGRDRRGFWLVEQRPRDCLPQKATGSRMSGARRLTCRRWSSATWAKPAPPGLHLPGPSHWREGLLWRVFINAQGEDVVAGVRTPNPVLQLGKEMPGILPTAPESA